jgi:Trk K+ transport system NAD-binding subunit
MRRSRKGLVVLLAVIPALIVIAALLYMAGMERFEGKERTFWDSLQFAGETLSTTGYGADARWRSPIMVVYIVLLQFAGVFLVFLIIPIFLVPFIAERFEERLPRAAPERIREHTVIFRFGPAVEGLLQELKAERRRFLVVETDEAAARLLAERDVPVVFTRDESEALEVAALGRARALVVNGSDEQNAGATLRARQQGFDGEIVAIIEEPMRRHALTLAGANAVFTPRHILAAALAARASASISPQLAGIQQLGAALQVRELRIQSGSPLVGTTLRESAITRTDGATVVGQWVGGRLVAPATPTMRLESRGILVVVGTPEALNRLAELAGGTAELKREGPFLIAGYGEVGRKVRELLTDVGEEVRTVDRNPAAGVDVVGNILDPGVLRSAGVAESQAVILALDTDDATLFAAMLVQDQASDVPVIARVNHARNVENIHRAGADFALSISEVSSQMLAQRLLGRSALALDTNLRIVRTTGAAVRRVDERDGFQIVAVERSSEVIVDPPRSLQYRDDDVVYLCGSDLAVREFR